MKKDLTTLSHKDIITARVCPYCGSTPSRVPSAEIYPFLPGNEFGFFRACLPCRAWVGEHKSGDKKGEPLGRLSDDVLRLFKKEAHHFFDLLWKRKMMVSKIEKNEARSAAYKWLSKSLDIEPDYCHIGMMDVEQCLSVIDLCKPIVQSWTTEPII